ncbi:MAG TPA: metallophosphoesterase family protein [Spirochaetia bacterium]|nr:metallophosphoesterase family protein [Spirochaetia bacterium]
MLKLAVLTDVHANLAALQAVLSHIEERRPDFVLCTGDLVGYGPHPEETVELIRRLRIPVACGNYDDAVGHLRPACGCTFPDQRALEIGSWSLAHAVRHTTRETRAFLASLPRHLFLAATPGGKEAALLDTPPPGVYPLVDPDLENAAAEDAGQKAHQERVDSFRPAPKPQEGFLVHLVHGSVRRLNEYLRYDSPKALFQELAPLTPGNVLVYGHTHQLYHKLAGDVHFVNAGTAGKPTHGNPNVTYAWLEIDRTVGVYGVEVPYDPQPTVLAMREAGAPGELIDLVVDGWS